MKKKVVILSVIAAVLAGAFFFAEKPPEIINENSEILQSSVSEQTSAEVSEKMQPSVISESPILESSTEENSEISVDESSQQESVSEVVSEEVQESEIIQPSPSEPVSESVTESDMEVIQESSITIIESSVEEIISVPESSVIIESSVEEVSEVSESQIQCTVSISCQTLLNNLDRVKKNKLSVIPEDGWVLTAVSAAFDEGESAFDVTKRVCMENQIPFEFTLSPVYHTAYIEGINNIYEFDCGSTSGWLYRVNGEFLSYGCSDYLLKDGDILEWVYTCNLGKDVGNEYRGE